MDREILRLVFISAAMSEQLEARAEMEGKPAPELAADFVGAHLFDFEDFVVEEAELPIDQRVHIPEDLDSAVEVAAMMTGAAIPEIIRACIRAGLESTPKGLRLN